MNDKKWKLSNTDMPTTTIKACKQHNLSRSSYYRYRIIMDSKKIPDIMKKRVDVGTLPLKGMMKLESYPQEFINRVCELIEYGMKPHRAIYQTAVSIQVEEYFKNKQKNNI